MDGTSIGYSDPFPSTRSTLSPRHDEPCPDRHARPLLTPVRGPTYPPFDIRVAHPAPSRGDAVGWKCAAAWQMTAVFGWRTSGVKAVVRKGDNCHGP